MGNSHNRSADYSNADNRVWLEQREQVPPDAWVVELYLIAIRELVYGMSNDFGGRSDPYVNIRLARNSPEAGPFGGQQAQRSSRKSSTLNPRWTPPEMFQFIIPADMVPKAYGGTAQSPSFPSIVLQVMDFDRLSSHDEMGHCSLPISDVLRRMSQEEENGDAASSTLLISSVAAIDGDKPGRQLDAVDGSSRGDKGEKGKEGEGGEDWSKLTSKNNDVMGPLFALPLQHPKSNETMKRTTLLLRATLSRRKDAFKYTEDSVVEHERWHPGVGWSSRNRSPGDPHRFALVVPQAASRHGQPAPPVATTSNGGTTNKTNPSAAAAAAAVAPAPPSAASSAVGFSSDNFDSVASLIRHDDDIDDDQVDVDGDGDGGRGHRVVVLQWSVMTHFGDAGGGWQYNTHFQGGNTSWSPRPSKFSFVRRRFWRRRILHRHEQQGGEGQAAGELGASREREQKSGSREAAAAVVVAPRRDVRLPLRVGWLMKRGEINTAFRARFFVLWPKALIYYKEEPPSYNTGEYDPQGVIPLKAAYIHWLGEDGDKGPGATKEPLTSSNSTAAASPPEILPRPPAADATPPAGDTFVVDVSAVQRSYIIKPAQSATTEEANMEAAGWMRAIALVLEKKYEEAAVVQTRSRVDSRMIAPSYDMLMT